jgi:Holliday junction resolvasome RuvABC DNA-binding subunit
VASSIVAAAPVSKEKVDAAIAYLENQQKIGTSEGAMLAALRSMGYGEKEIEQAFMNVEREGR